MWCISTHWYKETFYMNRCRRCGVLLLIDIRRHFIWWHVANYKWYLINKEVSYYKWHPIDCNVALNQWQATHWLTRDVLYYKNATKWQKDGYWWERNEKELQRDSAISSLISHTLQPLNQPVKIEIESSTINNSCICWVNQFL